MAEGETTPDTDGDPWFMGELRVFSFMQPPKFWASCDGQTLLIKDYQALFSLLGTSYGGDGVTTFRLPDLRARVPMQVGDRGAVGRAGGEAAHTLTQAELPKHNHALVGSNVVASGNVAASDLRLANNEPSNLYGAGNNLQGMHPAAIGVTGGSRPHENRQPYLALNICIALKGGYPKRPGAAS